jgi:hypothetical protein
VSSLERGNEDPEYETALVERVGAKTYNTKNSITRDDAETDQGKSKEDQEQAAGEKIRRRKEEMQSNTRSDDAKDIEREAKAKAQECSSWGRTEREQQQQQLPQETKRGQPGNLKPCTELEGTTSLNHHLLPEPICRCHCITAATVG